MTEPALGFLGARRSAFVAHLATRLSDLICEDTAPLAASRGIVTPVRSHSAVLFLAERGPATLTEMAQTDGQSHQLLASRLLPLERLGLIERTEDPQDGRRKPYRLTAAGRREAARIQSLTRDLSRAVEQLGKELGVDLVGALDQALAALQHQPLSRRVGEGAHA
ncbi:MAG: MarR family winged helix-turn-helix transcriptional regulator [Phenylobacterium sp.]|uniref:MarR family winged helix-turn-helix transcriptional regulator n=1 Tax=Phenylobacterium sp. TaxID=1871053 RepID=UPI00391D84E5